MSPCLTKNRQFLYPNKNQNGSSSRGDTSRIHDSSRAIADHFTRTGSGRDRARQADELDCCH